MSSQEVLSGAVLWPDPEAGPWCVRMHWRVQHGVPTPVGLSVTSWRQSDDEATAALPAPGDGVALPRLDASVLRQLRVGELTRTTREAAAAAAFAQADAIATTATDRAIRDQGLSDDFHAAVRQVEELVEAHTGLERGPRGRDLGDDHYRQVARVYRDAQIAGQPPTMAVAAWLAGEGAQESVVRSYKSAAAKQVARARRRGLLPATTPGRAGPITEGV